MYKCNHEKIYEKTILLSDPPLHPWTCMLCGEKGRDMIRESISDMEERSCGKDGTKKTR